MALKKKWLYNNSDFVDYSEPVKLLYVIHGFILYDVGVKRYFAPTDIHELLRCYATFAILKTFGFADFP